MKAQAGEQTIEQRAVVPAECAGERLDQVAAALFPDFSRSRLQQWIRSGELTLDGRLVRTRERVGGGEELALCARLSLESDWQAEAIELQVVHEDEALIVIDKPAGLVVHPAPGNRDGTLVNALLHRFPELAALPRAGIVHRLDKDTTGLMVVARSLTAHQHLVAQLAARRVSREYLALAHGRVTGGGTVDAAMGRHPRDRKRMAVLQHGGREARTHYHLLRRYSHYSLLRCLLDTGRTHQIRVHMAHIRHPLVGDPVYAGRPRPPAAAGEALLAQLAGFRRQALHARRLALQHPLEGVEHAWEAPPPADFQALLDALDADPQEAAWS